jgi:hypothetical protein
MAYIERQLRRIDLIDQQTLVRRLSPELMLVDPELASLAREVLREPGETNGKGSMSALLGTHDLTASSGIGLSLEPPLSPPVVRGPMDSPMASSVPMPQEDLPTPPPALRPPEAPQQQQPAPAPARAPEPAPAPAPAPVAPEAPAQLEPVQAPPPAQAPPQPDPVPLMAPPDPAPEPAPLLQPPAPDPEPAPAPEIVAPDPVVLPTMAPPEPELLPVAAPEPAPEPEPVEVALPEIEPVILTPPAAPAPVEAPPAAEIAPVEIAPEIEPVELTPIELPADPFLPAPAPEPVPELVVEPELPAEPAIEPSIFEQLETVQLQGPRGTFRIVVRLSDGDGVEVGEFRDFGTAMEGAQEVIEQFSNANGSWPFYAGRFIRPDLIVSVDVVDG